MSALSGPLTYWEAARVATNLLERAVLVGVAMRGLGDRLAYVGGRPTERARRVLAFDHCRGADDVRQHILRQACCQYCGGEITQRATCPGCGVPADEQ